jgi:rare lipoprotein A
MLPTRPLVSSLLVLLLATSAVAARASDADASTAVAEALASVQPAPAEAASAEPKPAGALPFIDDVETGIASWYGQNFHNKRTASGEAFNAQALTAAHPTLPFHTWVRVTLLSTGRSVIVRITDRGPHIANRLIDISRAAAAKIGLVQRGAGTVRIEPLADAPNTPSVR